jgi:hypothetical protein
MHWRNLGYKKIDLCGFGLSPDLNCQPINLPADSDRLFLNFEKH